MLGAVIGLIFTLIILGVVWWGCQQLLALIPMAEPFATIIRVVMVILMVIIVLYVAATLLSFAGIHVPMRLG